MIKKIINVLGDIDLTFWLLLGVTCLFIIGSFYSFMDYAFFESLDTMNIQNWLRENASAFPEKVWWVVALFFVLGVLGINTFLCACARIGSLLKRRKKIPTKNFLIALTPSLVHILFIVLLIGHLLTFTLGTYQRIPISNGSIITLPHQEPIKILNITLQNFPEKSLLKERVQQGIVTIQKIGFKTAPSQTLKFLNPLSWNGLTFHVDIGKKLKPDKKIEKGTTVCNRAQLPHADVQVFLLITQESWSAGNCNRFLGDYCAYSRVFYDKPPNK